MNSAYWVKYSQYTMIGDEGKEYIVPLGDAIPMAYDIRNNPADFLAAVINCAADRTDPKERLLRFAEEFGLPALALSAGGEMPQEKADLTEFIFRLTERTDDLAAAAFSKEYAERADLLSDWLDSLLDRFEKGCITDISDRDYWHDKDDITLKEAESFYQKNSEFVVPDDAIDTRSLQTMVESLLYLAICSKTLRRCPVCEKAFCNADPFAVCCSKDCAKIFVKHKRINRLHNEKYVHLQLLGPLLSS